MSSEHTQNRCRAFGLVEMLAAVAVLAVIVALTAQILAGGRGVWRNRGAKTDTDLAGRTAIGLLRRDLASAIADERLPFIVRGDTNVLYVYEHVNEELCFVSLADEASASNRAVREVWYWVQPMADASTSNRYELVRGVRAIDPNDAGAGYWTNTWYDTSDRPDKNGVVADNVTLFHVAVPGSGGLALNAYDSTTESGTNSNRLPRYVDVVLEVVSDDAAIQLGDMIERGIAPTNFLDRHARRYDTRVYFHNRNGYRDR